MIDDIYSVWNTNLLKERERERNTHACDTIMRVHLDATRLCHFTVLLALTLFGAYVLMDRYQWGYSSALGLAGTATVQMSNLVFFLLEKENKKRPMQNGPMKRKDEKTMKAP